MSTEKEIKSSKRSLEEAEKNESTKKLKVKSDKKDHKEEKNKKEKKEKKDKKEKKEKKDKKDKKEKKEKKEKKDKEEKKESKSDDTVSSEQTAVPAAAAAAAAPSSAEVTKFLADNSVKIEDDSNSNIQPCLSFDSLPVESKIISILKKFPKPSPIQAASWPFLLAGRDVVGVAETGSGKTFAFSVPVVNHIIQEKKKGVRALVVSPTRELAMQIYDSLVTLTNVTDISAVCVYGGVPKEEQRQGLKKASIVIATPGRLKDLIEEGSADLSKVEYLVLDEADRMLEKGFEEDIKSIVSNTNSDGRQTIMFTATWPPEVRKLASTFMNNAVKVYIGERDELAANKRITQLVEVIDPFRKEQRLLQLLKEHQSGAKKDDKILVFALYKKEATRVERLLQNRGFALAAIHGDLGQAQRTKALEDFKTGRSKILLATDVAARGLDIPAVKVVINLTFPLTAEDYVHRIGRTGRAGQTGLAITLFTEQEKHLSGALINVLRGANQPVPDELLKFGSHTKKKEHSAYGAFFKDVDSTKKATKVKFD
ncbi:RNA-dependent ATPase DBP3 [Sugiyamaella lignohabitans]|uniref:ATP-dependent RNA helicase DBP3 n=1 Tax=Sugiyamaella lignohabitans TaxID=796027 RepID=A0A167C0C1_9ASCO|nr:RNA-dependent ATPase DBP3 [Sugiyamaella lignohabitans]ANB11056.1 RNA-dependent ATPase DBP3 [Sugiyamaella lignohabitans]